jgi:hypothetical protein
MPTARSHPPTATDRSALRREGSLYFLGRPYAMYASRYGVPLRAGRPGPRRSPRAVAG